MIRRPPRSTQSRSSAASDVYKRQGQESVLIHRLSTWHGPVFLVNSRLGLVSATLTASPGKPAYRSGPPYPEVTGVFCRVPSPRFSRSPWYSLPIHLCRFRVRAANDSLTKIF